MGTLSSRVWPSKRSTAGIVSKTRRVSAVRICAPSPRPRNRSATRRSNKGVGSVRSSRRTTPTRPCSGCSIQKVRWSSSSQAPPSTAFSASGRVTRGRVWNGHAFSVSRATSASRSAPAGSSGVKVTSMGPRVGEGTSPPPVAVTPWPRPSSTSRRTARGSPGRAGRDRLDHSPGPRRPGPRHRAGLCPVGPRLRRPRRPTRGGSRLRGQRAHPARDGEGRPAPRGHLQGGVTAPHPRLGGRRHLRDARLGASGPGQTAFHLTTPRSTQLSRHNVA